VATQRNYTEMCPVCKGEISPDNPALYAMGWHVVVCSRECLGKLYDRLRSFERMTDTSMYREKNHHGILLCHECHMAVERIIHGREKHRGQLPEIEYFYIVIKFLEDIALE